MASMPMHPRRKPPRPTCWPRVRAFVIVRSHHGCILMADHAALSDAVHGIHGRLWIAEQRIEMIERRITEGRS